MTAVGNKLNQLLTIDDSFGETVINEDFKEWFLQQFDNDSTEHSCRLEDFALYFLNTVRLQTEVHLKSNETDSSKCSTPIRSIKDVAPSAESTNFTSKRLMLDQQSSTSGTPNVLQLSKSRQGSDINPVFDDSLQSLELNITSHQLESVESSFCQSLHSNTSTPVRRTPNSSSTYNQNRRSGNSFNNISCTTPNSTEKRSRNGSSVGASALCLGDFLVLNSPNARSHKKANSQSGGKPKKRVVPTTISTRTAANNSPFANNSAFSHENNILKLSSMEIVDRNKCSILEARKSLKLNASEISRELESSIGETKLNGVAAPSTASKIASIQLDQEELLTAINYPHGKQRSIIEKIAAIYSTIIDINLTTNVLNEISFLMNILNASETSKLDDKIATDVATDALQSLKLDDQQLNCSDGLELKDLQLLRNTTNCVYFASCVLNRQRKILAMLDLKSLGVVLHNERILSFSQDLNLFLKNVYQNKQTDLQQHKKEDDFLLPTLDKSFNNVYYQEDKDSRQNFSSNSGFCAFKSQRDLFYKTLKYWESNHLHPAWSFQQEITPKIRDLFRLSEHPVNMAHFSELFVSQLLISANYASSPEEIGVDIDFQKLSKLTQRLVAPSNFSVDYQFPNKQAFFRDFIAEARSIAFLEQLKLAIYAKLIMLNDSTLELLNMLRDDEDENITNSRNEFIVRPEVLSSLLVLAKFLGFINVLPFNFTNGTPPEQLSYVDKKQIELRNLQQQNFNFKQLLKTALENGKLLITLPWLVQYLAMLDNTTLQLDSYVVVTQLMFCIYMHMDMDNAPLIPTTVFIIRCCLGWLFDTKPIIADQYYSFRISCHQSMRKNDDWLQVLRWLKTSPHTTLSNELPLNPILESTLNVACPFLAEFRVSIMPAKYAMVKYASRSGRYRHITTRISELYPSSECQANNAHNDHMTKAKPSENTLVEAFLHSQNSTMRRLIEFVIERIYKSTVKDAQYTILLPSKRTADNQVNAINSKNYKQVFNLVHSIYQEARLSAIRQWDGSVPNIIKARITSALDALLPHETESIVKQTYFNIISRSTATRVNHWRHVNLFKTNFYCSNYEDLAQKICNVNGKPQQQNFPSELIIVKASPSVSNLLDELQYLLHCTSLRPELVEGDNRILRFLHQLPLTFENTLPKSWYRVVGLGVVQLLQNLIAKHPLLLSKELIYAIQSLWTTTEMHQYAIDSQKQCKDFVNSSRKDDLDLMSSTGVPSIFDGLVTSSFIESLGAKQKSFIKLKEVLIAMIHCHVITIDFVNGLFMKILKQEWHPNVLNELSNMLQSIASETLGCVVEEGAAVNGNIDLNEIKSKLFMEVLADFAREIDNF